MHLVPITIKICIFPNTGVSRRRNNTDNREMIRGRHGSPLFAYTPRADDRLKKLNKWIGIHLSFPRKNEN